ncbi:ornithine decarboxylase [[Candida] jaroonii]|uniref:Ornithine decarboxylase n=1 Tax=[Candida] jaroonii TaxID=467808 RepID=A0ACA9YEY2_9ASCO|nr:ornithine decarboxylase [[Candida] jaroonii]
MAPVLEELIENREFEDFNHEISKFNDGTSKHLEFTSQNSVLKKIIETVNVIDHDSCLPGEEDSFFIVNLKEVEKSLHLWHEKLPRIQPFYAVKCNHNIEVVKYLSGRGVNFDCASKNEIEFILNLGVDPSRIVYANPCKTSSYIRYAHDNGVNLTTVDNCHELYKIKKYHPNTDILIRIITDDESAQCQLSTKFGCDMETALEILDVAKELELNIKGVAFHIGSGATDNQAIFKAIKDCREIFDNADNLGFKLDTVDIGGGFQRESFDTFSSMINYSIDKFFPSTYCESRDLRFIAEPGRFMVSDAFTLVTHVIAKRFDSMIYVNDGVYGNLNCILFDHQNPIPQLVPLDTKSLDTKEPSTTSLISYSIYGPTCDGLDKIGDFKLPPVNVGDWLYFENVGAYTSVASTSFNGFVSDKFIYVE